MISLLLALILMLGAVMGTLSSCGDEKCKSHKDADGNRICDVCGSEIIDNTPGGNAGTGEKANYTVSVKTIGGMPLKDVVITVFDEDDLDGYATTDENGNATVSLEVKDGYSIKLSGAPAGYEILDSYSFVGTSAAITLTSRPIQGMSQSGAAYKLGDIIRDFTVTTVDGDVLTISELLKTKDAVLLNFWYTTCSWCITEFPFMEAAYQTYSDDIAIIALDPYTSDTAQDIRDFRDIYGLSFDMAQENLGLATAFGVTGYPTSVMIDRYGTICLIESGAITAEKYFNAIFEHFSGENYKQQLITGYEDLAPQAKPTVTQPSSEEIGAAVSSDGFSATYYPDNDGADAEYSWPFIIGEKGGYSCLVSTNSEIDSSFSTVNVDVSLKAGDVLAFDYLTSTEADADILYALVNGENIHSLSAMLTSAESTS